MMKDNQFDNRRRVIGAIAGPVLAAAVWWMPIGALSAEAHRLLAVMALVAVWWIAEPVASPVTSLLGPMLCVLLGVAPADKAFVYFANPMVFLFVGGFLLAKGMTVNGLDRRIAYGITSMRWVGDSPRRIFLAIGLACVLCSGWISNTATAAMMFPVALGLLEAIRDMMAAGGHPINLRECRYATGLMLMTAYACSIGGVLTPIGTPPNIIMIGFLGQLAPEAPAISFFQWMAWGAVAAACYFAVAYAVLWRMFPAEVDHIPGAREFIRRKAAELGPWTRAQKNTLAAFGTAVALWVAPSVLGMVLGPDSAVVAALGSHCPEAVAALVGGLMLFFLPVDLKKGQMTLTWKEGVSGIDWGTLLLFGGGLAMGGMMYTTGLSDWLGAGIKDVLGGNPPEVLFVGLFCVAGLVLSEFTSHTAATNLIGSIAIGTALSLGFSPIPVAVGVALSSSLGFMMPVSTPPNAIVYASGLVPITKMFKSGIIVDVVGVLLITIPLVLWLVKAVMGV